MLWFYNGTIALRKVGITKAGILCCCNGAIALRKVTKTGEAHLGAAVWAPSIGRQGAGHLAAEVRHRTFRLG